MTSDDVCSMLRNDLYERDKIAYQLLHAAEIMNS